MTRLGEILHSSGKNLVIKAECSPEVGAKVRIKHSNQPISGEIVDVFGSTENPYVSVKLNKDPGIQLESLEDDEVFLGAD